MKIDNLEKVIDLWTKVKQLTVQKETVLAIPSFAVAYNLPDGQTGYLDITEAEPVGYLRELAVVAVEAELTNTWDELHTLGVTTE